MDPSQFREALKSDQRIYGTLVVSTSPFWPKVIGSCGLDFIFIDTEHIAINRETLSWMCRAYSAMGLPPLVRITDPDPDKATIAYDDGAAGVVAPYVESKDQVDALIGASKFRPLKGQSVKSAISGQPINDSLGQYLNNNCANNSLVINIESVEAMHNMDSLLDTDQVDSILIGPHDLSTSLGLPEQYQHPEFLKAVEFILGKARELNTGAGIHFWGSHDEHVRLLNMGANVFIHKADVILFRQHLTDELAALKSAMNDISKTDLDPKISI